MDPFPIVKNIPNQLHYKFKVTYNITWTTSASKFKNVINNITLKIGWKTARSI